MKLKALLRTLKEAQVRGSQELHITGLANDSRIVAPGNLFIARRGQAFDGTRFIPDAVRAGAIAIASDLYDPSLRGITQIIYPDLRSLESQLAVAYYGDPSRKLQVFGITGTNGKTSTALLIHYLLQKLGVPTGLLGTIETIIGGHRIPAVRTTSDVLTNHRSLREMVQAGCRAVAMEVTSHGLDQRRTEGIAFDIGVFTNLSQDHLDYHQTMEAYAKAKAKLFAQCPVAVVNGDDPLADQMVSKRTLRFGQEPGADLKITAIGLTATGTSFTLAHRGDAVRCTTPLLGLFNVYNCAAAVAALIAAGHPLQALPPLLATAPAARGRMESVPNQRNMHVVVDYAHTPDALAKALEALRPLAKRQLIVVFGCGGDRDRDKRPMMGTVAARLADRLIITSDNPRSEDPAAICDAVAKGVPSSADCGIIVDRKIAIHQAVACAEVDDIILIAGKGHETYQHFDRKRVPFDDRQVAAECLAL